MNGCPTGEAKITGGYDLYCTAAANADSLIHYQFETIHSFLDGNGRVGRFLITLFLMEREIRPAPPLYLSVFFEATRRDYYDMPAGVHERAEWEGWLEYFLMEWRGHLYADAANVLNIVL